MADNNLMISVRADSSKLRADLAIAQAQIRELGSQLRAAAGESLKTGDTTAIAGLATAFEGARGRVAGLRAELSAATAPTMNLRSKFADLGGVIRNLAGVTFPQFGSAFAALGIVGAAAGIATGIGKITKAAADSITEAKNFAVASGLTIQHVGAIEDAFKQAGIAPDKARAPIERFGASLGKIYEEQMKLTGSLGTGVAMLKGQGGAAANAAAGVLVMTGQAKDAKVALMDLGGVLRGSQKDMVDWSSAQTALLGLPRVMSYTKDADGQFKMMADFSRELTKQPPAIRDMLGTQIYGRAYAETAPGFDILGKNAPELLAKRKASGLDATKPEEAQAGEYQKSVAEYDAQEKRAKEQIGLSSMPMMTDIMSGAATFIEAMRNMKVDAQPKQEAEGALGDPALPASIEHVGEGWAGLKSAAQSAIADIATKLDDLAKKITDTRGAFAIGAGSSGALGDVALPASVEQTAKGWAGLKAAAQSAVADMASKLDELAKKIADTGAAFAGMAALGGGASAGGPGTGTGLPDVLSGAGLMAAGGHVRGPGTGTSDSIPAWLSNGEYVNSARAVQHWGTGFFDMLNNPVPGFSLGGFVGGIDAALNPRGSSPGDILPHDLDLIHLDKYKGGGPNDLNRLARVRVDLSYNGQHFHDLMAPPRGRRGDGRGGDARTGPLGRTQAKLVRRWAQWLSRRSAGESLERIRLPSGRLGGRFRRERRDRV